PMRETASGRAKPPRTATSHPSLQPTPTRDGQRSGKAHQDSHQPPLAATPPHQRRPVVGPSPPGPPHATPRYNPPPPETASGRAKTTRTATSHPSLQPTPTRDGQWSETDDPASGPI